MNQEQDEELSQSRQQSFIVHRKDSIYMSIDQHVQRHKFKYAAFMVSMGLINNTGYVVVGSGSQEISKKFDEVNLMGLFNLALILFSSVVRIINMRYLIKVLHRYRIFVVVGISSLGYVVIAISCMAERKWGFWISLVGSVLCGSMQALGEGVMLGFLKSFPPELVGAFSSGTGLAGIVGSLGFIALDSLGVSLPVIFFCLIPLELFYMVSFIWYEKKKAKHAPNSNITIQNIITNNSNDQNNSQYDEQSLHSIHNNNNKNNKQENSQSFEQSSQIREQNEQEQYQRTKTEEELEEEEVALPEQDIDASGNVQLSCASFKLVFPKIWFGAVNIGLVYFFEYSCTVGFANKITSRLQDQNPDDTGFFISQSYPILNFCYQFGVFVSRSSLSIIKIKKVWILTILQFINFMLYFSFAYYDYMPMGGLIAIMFWTGLMGGASYVNVMYNIVNANNIAKKEKEMCVNIVSIFNDMGVLTASLFSTLADTVILKNR